eukprot:scaffold51282_cov67-Phaeocystis_antarctica.AAC.5
MLQPDGLVKGQGGHAQRRELPCGAADSKSRGAADEDQRRAGLRMAEGRLQTHQQRVEVGVLIVRARSHLGLLGLACTLLLECRSALAARGGALGGGDGHSPAQLDPRRPIGEVGLGERVRPHNVRLALVPAAERVAAQHARELGAVRPAHRGRRREQLQLGGRAHLDGGPQQHLRGGLVVLLVLGLLLLARALLVARVDAVHGQQRVELVEHEHAHVGQHRLDDALEGFGFGVRARARASLGTLEGRVLAAARHRAAAAHAQRHELGSGAADDRGSQQGGGLGRAADGHDLHRVLPGAEARRLVGQLHSKLARWRDDEHLVACLVRGLQPHERRQQEGERLAAPRLRVQQHALARQRARDRRLLDRRGRRDAAHRERRVHVVGQRGDELGEARRCASGRADRRRWQRHAECEGEQRRHHHQAALESTTV